MATENLTISAVRQANVSQGMMVSSGVTVPTDGKVTVGSNYQMIGAGAYIYYYYAGGVKFGNLTAANLANKYLSSLTIEVNVNMSAAFVFRALESGATATSDGNAAYQNFTSGTIIRTAAGAGTETITITDSALIRKVLLNGIGISYTSSMLYYTFPANNISLSYTYTDGAAPSIVSNLSPSGTTILSTAATRMSWSFTQESGAAQTHYDLQYSYDDGTTWTTLANKTASANKYHDVPADTFTAGVVKWRVRTWTATGTIASDWASAQVIVKTNPNTSTVSCDGKPRPTVTWTSTGQTGYQVRIGDRDSGGIFGTATSYKSPYYYDDGVYPVTMRVQSSSGTWSAWSEPIYTQITNNGSGALTLVAAQDGNAVRLNWATDATCISYLVYRNGTPIAQTTAAQYLDNYSNGLTTYAVRGILSTGHYVSSGSVMVPVRMPCDVISAVDPISWQYLKLSLSRPSRSYDISPNVQFKNYAGRKKPIPVTDGHTSKSYRATRASKTSALPDAIKALVGKILIVKDVHGGRMFGVITNYSEDTDKVFSFDITIVETDYIEEVMYADS